MLCGLIHAASLIIWDEALMTHKIAFEALDRTLCDIIKVPSSANNKVTFGGKVVVLGGDLRQTLPVVQGGSRADIIKSAIIYSTLWSHVTILNLTLNMRLRAQGLTDESKKELAKFSKWMLDIGEGKINAVAKQDETEPSWIEILQGMYMDTAYLRERAIFTPTNDIADTINSYIVSLLLDEERHYLSADSILKLPNTHDSYDLLYPVEFLNSLNGNNFPQHKLSLKKGVPVMLL
jgi:ATP-dependent DNA helicase PIF1